MVEISHTPILDKPAEYQGELDIKIFVSHRIDLNSVKVENPLYIPIRCGAVYDKQDNTAILGDNTGENISERRMSYCELTVLYWMWKNVESDYYGLSHYRRYLSFAEQKQPGAWQEQCFMDSMTEANLERCGLLNETDMRKEIALYDMIVPVEFPVAQVVTPRGTGFENTYEYVTSAWEHLFIEKQDIDNMLNIIDLDFPEYGASARQYMNGHTFRGFNIFILKKELFHSLCEFEFGVLERMESLIDYSHASDSRKRAPGYLGEILYSIWVYHQTKNERLKIKEKQIVFFQDTGVEKDPIPTDKETVNICFPCEYNELALLGVSIKSIMRNISVERKYRILVLLKNMPENKFFVMEQERQKKYLQGIVKDHKNVTVEFFDPKNGLGEKDVRLFNEPDVKKSFYAVLLPWILSRIERVVWLTPHVIVTGDVATLYDWELRDFSIAATKDILAIANLNGYNSAISQHLKILVNLKDPYKYVDSDVMVLNLQKLRNKYDVEDIHKKLKTARWQKMSPEHDMFNVLYENEISILPQEWNVMNRPIPELLQCMDYADSELLKEFNAVKEPKLINFKNGPRPWETVNCDYSWEFWQMARETPFYEQILSYQTAGIYRAICDLQGRTSAIQMPAPAPIIVPHIAEIDTRSGARKFADKWLPHGTKRREFAKLLLPKGSLRWRFCKQIYYIFRPKYRPAK